MLNEILKPLLNTNFFQEIPNAKACTCKTDLCNKAIAPNANSEKRTCFQCSNFEDKRYECDSPEDTGKEVNCQGYCVAVSYCKYM